MVELWAGRAIMGAGYHDLGGEQPSVMGFVGPPDSIAEARERVVADHGEKVAAIDVPVPKGQRFLYIRGADNTKAMALALLCTHLGVSIERVTAFGDWHNDIELLKAAGCGVAMKNAPRPAREAADLVCPYTNDEDGVALFIEERILGAG